MDNSVKDSQKGETHEKLHVNTVGGVMATLGRRTGVIDDQCRVRCWITTVFINYKKYIVVSEKCGTRTPYMINTHKHMYNWMYKTANFVVIFHKSSRLAFHF